MSVNLFYGGQAARIAETLENQEKREKLQITESEVEDYQRAIWYLYVSNVTSYNLQYRESADIEFKGWEDNRFQCDSAYDFIIELDSLYYNSATNDGNVFMPIHFLNMIESLLIRLKKEQWYKLEQHDRMAKNAWGIN